MRSPLCLLLLVASITCGLSATSKAHEDDPKILHVKPPVKGPGYRAGDWGRGKGFEVSGSMPEFQAENVTLLSWLPLAEFGALNHGNDCWGYTAPSGREYALFGSNLGTHVVEVSVPSDPVLVGSITGPISLWRDIKTYGTRAYAVSEGGSGIQVISLANVDGGQVTLTNTVTSGGTNSSHNVAIDTTSGYLYRCGGSSEGLRFYNLANPNNPQYVGEWSDRYVHDAQIKTFTSGPYAGRQIAFCFSGFNGGSVQTGLSIVDVTNKSNPVHRGQISWPNAGYSHQGWLSEDGTLMFVDDELDEGGQGLPTTTYVLDVSNIDNPAYLGSFDNGNPAIGHNLYIKGDFAYEANYRSGLRVFDVSDPLNAVETAWFDTDPDSDGKTFNGLWSNYPYFSGDLVIGSDLERGLFMMWAGTPILDIEVVGGAPTAIDPDGQTLSITLTELNPGDYLPGSAELHYDDGSGGVSVSLNDLGGGSFSVDVPSMPCGTVLSYYFTALSTNGITWVEPPNGPAYEAVIAYDEPVILVDEFEVVSGWSIDPASTATEGAWVQVDPIGTLAQPEDDHSDPGTQCFVTGQGSATGSPGILLNEADVDNGHTTLLSPVMDLTGTVHPRVSYWRWYSNHKGINPGQDILVIDASDDGGATWLNIERVGPAGLGTEGGWFKHEFYVQDYFSVTDSFRLRFKASDSGPPSTVEAAIDDVRITAVGCPDCNGNSISDALDISFGGSLDLDAEGTPDECQPLSANSGTLSALSGGTIDFTLAGGISHASELYWLLGSLSGTSPGYSIGSVQVPLVQDTYHLYTLLHPNEPPLLNTLATLDTEGGGAAQFQLTAPLPSLIGLTAHHAWIALDPGTFSVTFASNALPLAFSF